jgi:hypothetical protein
VAWPQDKGCTDVLLARLRRQADAIMSDLKPPPRSFRQASLPEPLRQGAVQPQPEHAKLQPLPPNKAGSIPAHAELLPGSPKISSRAAATAAASITLLDAAAPDGAALDSAASGSNASMADSVAESDGCALWISQLREEQHASPRRAVAGSRRQAADG